MRLLPWIGMLLVLASIVLLAKKVRAGFFAGVVANVLFLAFNIHVALWPYAACNVVFIGTYIYGWRTWGRR